MSFTKADLPDPAPPMIVMISIIPFLFSTPPTCVNDLVQVLDDALCNLTLCSESSCAD